MFLNKFSEEKVNSHFSYRTDRNDLTVSESLSTENIYRVDSRKWTSIKHLQEGCISLKENHNDRIRKIVTINANSGLGKDVANHF